MATKAALLVALAVARTVTAAPAASAAWSGWSASASTRAASTVDRRNNCPIPAFGYTDLASLIGVANTQPVSPIANCLVQDGNALRPGRVIHPTTSDTQVGTEREKGPF